jgi:hypothetical protein
MDPIFGKEWCISHLPGVQREGPISRLRRIIATSLSAMPAWIRQLTADQLGLQPPTFFERLFKPRDYKPYALQMLIRTGAVLFTDNNKMCLMERRFQEIRQELGMQ